ncbi:uncharacterized protein BJ212DRAFT_1479642 [Suillus subaureus]|uniref:Uncharacterized protein n=1 Tax=Suillus subaureus TaxID=48587 RepID=A0A9P7JF03_9AGAM|nr:uncharacterized protein BJ212DRAFT_1479642 [Suillus subaureus]KAG1818643.1 hypothetical protein BJ212DRAFT_1479642 [Suillus subaureus]
MVLNKDPGVYHLYNEIEDFVDPVLPISEPPSSLLPETMLTEATKDPEVWRLINKIEDFVDPNLLTLLISSWLNHSYGSVLHHDTLLN